MNRQSRKGSISIRISSADMCGRLKTRPATSSIFCAAERPVAPSSGIAQDMINPSAHQQMPMRSEEHTSELQSLMRISYAVFCLKKKKHKKKYKINIKY